MNNLSLALWILTCLDTSTEEGGQFVEQKNAYVIVCIPFLDGGSGNLVSFINAMEIWHIAKSISAGESIEVKRTKCVSEFEANGFRKNEKESSKMFETFWIERKYVILP
jgi:hypothetical protein